MSTSTHEFETVGVDAVDMTPYDSFEMDGGVVIYDARGTRAWIHAPASVNLEDAR